MRATSREGSVAIACPSSRIAPDVGRSSRAIPRSRVDLPQALAPTITVVWPSGSSVLRSATTGFSPYPRVTSRATSRLGREWGGRDHHDLLEARPVASSHSRKGAPKAPVTTPTG